MDHEIDHENLLNDVLAEASPSGFRDAMLVETLRLAGQRRRWRNARRAGATLAMIAIITAVLLHRSPNTTVISPLAGARSYALVRTRPLPTAAILGTRPLSAGQMIASSSAAGAVAIIRSHDAVRIINDDELLALVSSRPAMLVRLAPGLEQLVFVNPEDEKGFPLN